MANPISNCYLEINGERIDAISIDDSVKGNKKVVKAMTRNNRPLGHVAGCPEFALNAEFSYDTDLNTRFDRMLLENTEFSAVLEYDTGAIITYTRCQIYDFNQSSSEGDDSKIKLDIQALGRLVS